MAKKLTVNDVLKDVIIATPEQWRQAGYSEKELLKNGVKVTRVSSPLGITSEVETRVLQDLTYEGIAKSTDSEKFMLKQYLRLINHAPSSNSNIQDILTNPATYWVWRLKTKDRKVLKIAFLAQSLSDSREMFLEWIEENAFVKEFKKRLPRGMKHVENSGLM